MSEQASLYDQFANNVAPAQPESRRKRNWQSASNENTASYKANLPRHVAEVMQVTQKDNSYYEFQKHAFGHRSIDDFGARVNEAFGKLEKGFNFIEQREKYKILYKSMMEQL